MNKDAWAIELGTVIMSGADMSNGLSEQEIANIEEYWQFRFPPDLRELLQIVLPISERFPDWRRFRSEEMSWRMEWPIYGICSDVESNTFWYPAWGERPATSQEALEIARDRLRSVPKLIPIFSHRYLPATPEEVGNPVLSVYHTDVIYYGSDLREYLMREFGDVSHRAAVRGISKRIPFWSDVVENDYSS